MSSKSCLAVAAEAAERVNAMLVAKGKLKINGVTGRSSGDLFTTEVEINDAPLPARNVLTKGIFQEEICRSTGAVMSTRGRYMSGMEKMNSGSGDRALYLHIQAPTVDAIEKAMARINMVIREHTKEDANFTDPTAELVQQQIAESNAMAAAAITLLTAQAAGHHYIQDKIFVGLEHAPVTYPVREKILGPGSAYIDHIKTTTGANVTLRGKGSGFLDPASGREAFEPLHIHITHPTLEGLQAAKSLAISLIQTTHADFAEWQQQQLAALTFQSAMALPAATQQLASATPGIITGLGQVFQPVAAAGEVQAQGILVSPGVMGAQSASIMLPMSQGMPSSVSYVTALPQTQATAATLQASQLALQQQQQFQQSYQVPPPSLQSTITSATIYPHLRHQYAQYAAKKKYDVPPPSLSVPTVATVPTLSTDSLTGAAAASSSGETGASAISAPAVALPSTNATVLLPTDTSVPPPNMAVPSLAAVPPPSKAAVHTTVVSPANAAVARSAAVPLPADTTMPPPTNTAAPPPPTDTSVPPPNYSANDGWRFRVPPPPPVTVPPTFVPVSICFILGVRTCVFASKAINITTFVTLLCNLRPQAKSSYLSSYQASALPEDEYNSYGKPAAHTNGSSQSSTSVTGAADTSARHSAESSAKKSDWEMMPPPSQAKPTPSRISSLVSYTYPNLKRPGDPVANSDWKRPRGGPLGFGKKCLQLEKVFSHPGLCPFGAGSRTHRWPL
ncbi:hypothetical protein MTO96_021656 [Rhipicephalus appendiculatus]